MPLSLFDQETEIHSSSVYDDSTAPTEAAFETNPVELQTDLNNIRSMLHELRDIRTSNWWSAITAPTTFTTDSPAPAARGVQDVGQDLWDIERQRILRRRQVIGADITVPAAVAATGVLTLAGNAANGETVTIDTKTYTFQTTLTDVDGNVLIGATASDSIDNLIAAITLGAGSGTTYAASTTLHPTVTAAAGAGDTMDATAKSSGTAGNSIATTETMGSGSWGAVTLTGGAGDVVILGSGELPGNTTAAVGAVTTLGTVVAYESSFGSASLAEVAGGNAVTPKNLCLVVRGTNGDAILDSSGREIYALLQSETVTDGHTITDTTTTRVQLSFVKRNSTADDLILADAADIAGAVIDYSPIERYAFGDMPEHSWLGDDFIDLGAAATDRQAAYDNQGTTPVDQTTNAIFDLESAGIYWEIRDDAEATLFRVTEGSAGGTTTIAIEDDVDFFDVDAADVDFDAGISVRSGGSRPIDVGVNDGIIESTAGDLELQATSELWFDDGNKPAGWSLAGGIKLSEDAQEWTDAEAVFGEVSLLSMLLQAREEQAVAEEWAHVTADIAANVNVTGAGGTPNISAQMPSYKGISALSTTYGVWLFINGKKQRPGADQAAGMDWYPHPTAGNQATGDFYLNYKLKVRGGSKPPDNVNMVVWGTPTP